MEAASRLKDVHFLRTIPEPLVQQLAAACRTVELDAGDNLFRQDDPGDSFYIIEDGQVHVTRHYENGEELILATLGPYEVVGEMSMLAREKRGVSVDAVGDCSLTALDSDLFYDTMASHPEMAAEVLASIGKYLHNLHRNVHEHSICDAEVRLASLLLLMVDHDSGIVTEQLHRRQMARASGVDSVWLKQTLKLWEAQGIVQQIEHQLRIIDMAALRDIARQ